MNNTIIFNLKSSTQTHRAGIKGQSVTGEEAAEIIAKILNLPQGEVALFMKSSGKEIGKDQKVESFSEIEVERCAKVKGGPKSAYVDAQKEKDKQFQGVIGEQRGGFDPMKMGTSSGGTMLAASAGGSGLGQPMTEEEKIMALSNTVGQETGAQHTGGGRGPRQQQGQGLSDNRPPSQNYVCHNCGNKGHRKQDCPFPQASREHQLQNPIGIAENQLERLTREELDALGGKYIKGVHYITKAGQIVRRKVDNAMFAGVDLGRAIDGDDADIGEIPIDLQCRICKRLVEDAVVTPCCQGKKNPSIQFCKTCFDKLVFGDDDDDEGDKGNEEDEDEDEEDIKCPGCNSPITEDDYIPDEEKRKEVKQYLNSSRQKRPRE